MGKSCSRRDRLVEEVRYEIGLLRVLAAKSRELAAVPASERRPWDAAAAGKFISDVCAGLENLCKRRYVYDGLRPPHGSDSHSRMLDDFLTTPQLGGRLPAVLALRLKKHLRFRHRFVHGYAFEVSWAMVDEPLRMLPETVDALCAVWEAWMEELPKGGE